MISPIAFYQNITLRINPIAFRIGFFHIGWYSLSYLASFAVIYLLLIFRIKKKEIFIQNFSLPESPERDSGKLRASESSARDSDSEKAVNKLKTKNQKLIDSFFLCAIPGVLIGGRLGYVLFYNFSHYLKNPIEIILPYNFLTREWVGIYGMSYHGGLLAVILIAIWFCKKNKINFLAFSDFIAPAIPAGYFFGRVGNFLNGELYGRITDSAWGMYFSDAQLRYPSQLIEAILEGAVIFLILWIFRNKEFLKGRMLFLYIFLYGLARFLAEFFREPDPQIGYLWNWLTLGQIFSLGMIIAGSIFLFMRDKSRNVV